MHSHPIIAVQLRSYCPHLFERIVIGKCSFVKAAESYARIHGLFRTARYQSTYELDCSGYSSYKGGIGPGTWT